MYHHSWLQHCRQSSAPPGRQPTPGCKRPWCVATQHATTVAAAPAAHLQGAQLRPEARIQRQLPTQLHIHQLAAWSTGQTCTGETCAWQPSGQDSRTAAHPAAQPPAGCSRYRSTGCNAKSGQRLRKHYVRAHQAAGACKLGGQQTERQVQTAEAGRGNRSLPPRQRRPTSSSRPTHISCTSPCALHLTPCHWVHTSVPARQLSFFWGSIDDLSSRSLFFCVAAVWPARQHKAGQRGGKGVRELVSAFAGAVPSCLWDGLGIGGPAQWASLQMQCRACVVGGCVVVG